MCAKCSFFLLFSSVDVYDLVLVDVFKYVRRVHEDAYGAHCGHDEEDVQLQAVDHHGHELPVFAYLERSKTRVISATRICGGALKPRLL